MLTQASHEDRVISIGALPLLAYTVFRRTDDYVRYDFRWYGFGYHKHWLAKDGMCQCWWINSYVRAPLRVNWIHSISWYPAVEPHCRLSRRWLNLSFSGSWHEPYQRWELRFGRLGIGGNTFGWVRWIRSRQDQRRLRQRERFLHQLETEFEDHEREDFE